MGNWNDSISSQNFQTSQMAGMGVAAASTNANVQFGQAMQGGAAIATQLGMKITPSPITDELMGSTMNSLMPWAQMAGGGVFDAMGLGAPGYHMQVGMSQRGYMPQGLSRQQAQARGKQLGAVTSQIYNSLYDPHAANPVANTYGYGGGQLGGLTRAAMRMGLGGPGDLLQGDGAARGVAFSRSAGQQASAVRDMGGPYAMMNDEQTMGMVRSMTLGGTGLDSLQRSMHIREMTQLARLTGGEGMDIGVAQGLQIQAAQYSRQIGGDYRVGRSAASRALAEGSYYDTIGEKAMTDAGTSKEQLIQKGARLTANAVNSTVGGQMAATMAAGSRGLLDSGSELYQQYLNLKGKDKLEALQSKGDAIMAKGAKDAKFKESDEYKDFVGSNEYKDYQNVKGGMGAKGEYKYQHEGDWLDMAARSGVTRREAQSIRQNSRQNIKDFHGDIKDAARNAQWDVDIAPHLEKLIGGEMSRQSEGKYGKDAGAVITRAIKESAGMTREQEIKHVEEKLRAMGMSEHDAKHLGEAGVGVGAKFLGGRGYENEREADLLHSDAMKEKTAATEHTAGVNAAQADKDAGKGQMQWPQRLFEALKSGDLKKGLSILINAVPAVSGGAGGPGGGGGGTAAAGPLGPPSGGAAASGGPADVVAVRIVGKVSIADGDVAYGPVSGVAAGLVS
jgi:hypothetical protein